jgi:hypothetical protein
VSHRRQIIIRKRKEKETGERKSEEKNLRRLEKRNQKEKGKEETGQT